MDILLHPEDYRRASVVGLVLTLTLVTATLVLILVQVGWQAALIGLFISAVGWFGGIFVFILGIDSRKKVREDAMSTD